MNSNPTHASVSASGGLASRRDSMPSGSSNADAVSSSETAAAGMVGNAETMRAPTYRCSSADSPRK